MKSLLHQLDEALGPVAGRALDRPLRLLFLVAFDRLKAAEIGNPVSHHLVVLRHALLFAQAEGLNPLVLGAAAITHDLAPVEKVRTADVAAQTDPAAARRLERHRIECRVLHMREGAAAGLRLMAYVNQLADEELFSPEVAERVYGINSVHDDPSIGRPLPDQPDYHAFRAADRLWQLAEGFPVDLQRNRCHPKWAQLTEQELAANQLAAIQQSYSKERRLYPDTAPGFFGDTMLRNRTAFELYERLVRKRASEYGL